MWVYAGLAVVVAWALMHLAAAVVAWVAAPDPHEEGWHGSRPSRRSRLGRRPRRGNSPRRRW